MLNHNNWAPESASVVSPLTKPQMRIDVICPAAPWENTTTDADRAYDLAYDLSEEYQCDVDLRYNESGIIFTTVSNY